MKERKNILHVAVASVDDGIHDLRTAFRLRQARVQKMRKKLCFQPQETQRKAKHACFVVLSGPGFEIISAAWSLCHSLKSQLNCDWG